MCENSSLDINALLSAKDIIGLVESNDGLFSTVKESHSLDDLSKQSLYFGYHTDGLYLREVPSVVILYCKNPGIGKATTKFIDTRKVASLLIKEYGDSFPGRLKINYVGRGNIVYQKDLLFMHKRSGELCMHWGSRIFLSPNLADDLSQIPTIRYMHEIHSFIISALDNSSEYEHKWKASDIIAFENTMYIHSRASNGIDEGRELMRFYIS
jgi:alpha-ketoglutarate-dependent taurine dioxygenase